MTTANTKHIRSSVVRLRLLVPTLQVRIPCALIFLLLNFCALGRPDIGGVKSFWAGLHARAEVVLGYLYGGNRGGRLDWLLARLGAHSIILYANFA